MEEKHNQNFADVCKFMPQFGLGSLSPTIWSCYGTSSLKNGLDMVSRSKPKNHSLFGLEFWEEVRLFTSTASIHSLLRPQIFNHFYIDPPDITVCIPMSYVQLAAAAEFKK